MKFHLAASEAGEKTVSIFRASASGGKYTTVSTVSAVIFEKHGDLRICVSNTAV